MAKQNEPKSLMEKTTNPGTWQGIYAYGRSSIRNVNQTSVHLPPDPQIYCYLQVIDAENQNPVSELLPGRNYFAKVKTDVNGSEPSRPLTITNDLSLILNHGIWLDGKQLSTEELEACGDTVSVSDPTCILPKDSWKDFSHLFSIQVADSCPRIQLKLTLSYTGGGSPFSIDEKEVLVNSLTNCFPRKLALYNVALNKPRPENAAFLEIVRSGKELTIWGWWFRNRPYYSEPLKSLPSGLSEFIDQKVRPQTIEGFIRNFQRIPAHKSSIERLRQWLNMLRTCAVCGLQECNCPRPHLVIIDQTGLDIPWEMLRISPHEYVGTAFSVVRWTRAEPDFGSPHMLEVNHESKAGKLLVFLDGKLSNIQQELTMIEQFQVDYVPALSELNQLLSKPMANVGLVYLACHGVLATDYLHQAHLGDLHDPYNNLVVMDLELLEASEVERPVFFVNACHAARLIQDDDHLFGLPEVLLAHVASGYLGPLSYVDSEYATEIMKSVIEEACRDDGIPVAEMLRQLRIKAVEQLRIEKSLSNYLRFLYTFMYVFYGNPLLRLTLAERQ